MKASVMGIRVRDEQKIPVETEPTLKTGTFILKTNNRWDG